LNRNLNMIDFDALSMCDGVVCCDGSIVIHLPRPSFSLLLLLAVGL